MSVKISIITVAYNSEDTIERTIKSVLAQTVLPYEYLIIDGASSDNTLEIAEKYRSEFEKKQIAYHIFSEPDDGIYDAMNKGIKKAQGELIGMINSDDWYEKNALQVVSHAYETTPFDLFFADLIMHMPNGKTFIKRCRNRRYATSRDWNHPTTFITKKMYETYQYRNETIHDDYDLILRIKKAGARVVTKNIAIANFTMNGVSHQKNFGAAMSRVMIKYRIYRQNGYSPIYFFECFLVELAKLIVG